MAIVYGLEESLLSPGMHAFMIRNDTTLHPMIFIYNCFASIPCWKTIKLNWASNQCGGRFISYGFSAYNTKRPLCELIRIYLMRGKKLLGSLIKINFLLLEMCYPNQNYCSA